MCQNYAWTSYRMKNIITLQLQCSHISHKHRETEDYLTFANLWAPGSCPSTAVSPYKQTDQIHDAAFCLSKNPQRNVNLFIRYFNT